MKRRRDLCIFIFAIAIALAVLALPLIATSQKLSGNVKVAGASKVCACSATPTPTPTPSASPGGVLVVDGNSIPYCYTCQGQDFSNLAMFLRRRIDVGYGVGIVNAYLAALPGLSIEVVGGGMITRGPEFVDSHYLAGYHNVVVSQEYLNQCVIGSPPSTIDQGYTLYQQYGAERKAAGWTHLVMTMTSTPGIGPPWEDVNRYLADTKLRTGSAAGWDGVIDLAANATVNANIVVPTAHDDHPENYMDPVHLAPPGIGYETDAAFPQVVAAFGLPAPTSLSAKLWTFYPMWTNAADLQFYNTPDYWGTNPAGISSFSTQHDDYVSFPSSGSTGIKIDGAHSLHARSSGFAVSGWFRPRIGGVYDAGSIGRGQEQWLDVVWESTVDGKNEYKVSIPASGTHLVFKTSDDGTEAASHSVTSTITLANTGTVTDENAGWFFFTAGYDGTNIFISVNNETPVTTAVSTIKTNSSGRYQIGSDNPEVCFIGDVKRYGFTLSPLTPTERSYLYNSGTPRNTLFGSN